MTVSRRTHAPHESIANWNSGSPRDREVRIAQCGPRVGGRLWPNQSGDLRSDQFVWLRCLSLAICPRPGPREDCYILSVHFAEQNPPVSTFLCCPTLYPSKILMRMTDNAECTESQRTSSSKNDSGCPQPLILIMPSSQLPWPFSVADTL